jgi:Skp family chaperone for outer membrane proteins
MNLLKRIFFFILILCHPFSLVYANQQISFLDVDAIMKQTIQGKEIVKNLNELNKKNLTLLRSKENKIKDLEKKINNQKNIISKEELKSKIDILQNEVLIFRKEKEKLMKEFDLKKNQELTNFFKKVSPLIQEYIKEKNIDIILDKKNIFMANESSNITKDVVVLLNEKLK